MVDRRAGIREGRESRRVELKSARCERAETELRNRFKVVAIVEDLKPLLGLNEP